MRRKPRPLARDKAEFRDDRLLLIACDDKFAPAHYFDAFEFRRVKVEVVTTQNGTSVPQYVLDRLLEYLCDPDDERWLVLDTDHLIKGTHLAGFMQTLQKAGQARVNIALSRPCFELWLLLHHVDETQIAHLKTAKQVTAFLRQTMGEYNKYKLKSEHYPPDKVVEAILRAERLDGQAHAIIPPANATRVYLIWRSILAFAQLDDLPAPLAELALTMRTT